MTGAMPTHDAPRRTEPAPSAIVLFCHGARDAGWRAPFDAALAQGRRLRPDLAIELAFLELMSPRLPEAIDALVGAGHRHIVVSPLFLAPGSHTERDLPALLDAARQRHPGVTLAHRPALLQVDALREAIARWAVDAPLPARAPAAPGLS